MASRKTGYNYFASDAPCCVASLLFQAGRLPPAACIFLSRGLRDNSLVSSPKFDFTRVDRVTAGAVGPPGKRSFYLQVRQGGEIVSLALEKEQLRLLAERLQELLGDLSGQVERQPGDMALQEPLVEAWRVGAMTLAFDEEEKLIEVSLLELVEEGQDAATGHFWATMPQMQALAKHAVTVIAAGRPPCPMCFGPIDHDGGVCPRLDGHH